MGSRATFVIGVVLVLIVGCRDTARPEPTVAAAPSKPSTPHDAARKRLVVRVQDEAGAPIEGVTVRIMAGEGSPERATSDARGEVEFDVVDVVQVIVDDPTHPPVMDQPDLVADGPTIAVITVPPVTRLAGTVVDADAKPIAGARVRFLAVGSVVPPETTTDADGRFGALLSAGSWRMEASGEGRSATWATLEIPPGQASASVAIAMPKSASLLVDTDCVAKGCTRADVELSVGNSGFVRYLDDAGTTTFPSVPIGEGVVTVRDAADPRHPRYATSKVELEPGVGARVALTIEELDASATITGVLVESSGKRATTRSGGRLVVDVSCRGFQSRVVASRDGTFTAGDLLPGKCTLTGLRIDPRDPMSGANGGRIPTTAEAPAADVEVRVNDFFHR